MTKKRGKKARRSKPQEKELEVFKRLTRDDIKFMKKMCLQTVRAFKKERTLSNIVGVVEKTLAKVEDILEYIKLESPPKIPIACKEGCFYCCYYEPEVTALEVIHISNFVQKSFTTEELISLRKQIVRLHEMKREMNEDEKANSGLPCPLLVNCRCSIYPVRPLMCRGWNSFDVSFCRLTYRTGETIGDPNFCYVLQNQLMLLAQLALRAGLNACGYKPEPLKLFGALHVALNTPSAVDQWLRGKTVFSQAQKNDTTQLGGWFWEKFRP